ncbi:MAG: ATP-binding protein [Candidatus Micrarchaeota archaeon]
MDPDQKEAIIKRWQNFPKTFAREIEDEILPLTKSKNAIFLYGPRRAGKSVISQRLLKKSEGTIRYLNFDDPALPAKLANQDIEELCSDLSKGSTVVLDEVQNVDGWEKWVRATVDTVRFHLIVTGSSAKLLSSEFATTLAGRGIGFLILPLSYKEFRQHTANKNFEDYLSLGGYPEVVLTQNKLEMEKLWDAYFDLAIVKDVINRYSVRDPQALRSLAVYLLTNSTKTISFRSLKGALGISFDAIRQYLDYLETAFLHFTVPFFAYSLKKSMEWPRKTYSWDLGLQSRISRSFSPDIGRKTENAVAIELKRRNFETYYWKGEKGLEVDFIARKGPEILPINVSYTDKLAERETKALEAFMEEHKLKYSLVLSKTKKSETIKTSGNGKINIKNIEDWLLHR